MVGFCELGDECSRYIRTGNFVVDCLVSKCVLHHVTILLKSADLVIWDMSAELQNQDTHMGESPSVAQMQNQQNRDQQYLAVRVGSGQQALSIDSASYKTDSAGNKAIFKQNH